VTFSRRADWKPLVNRLTEARGGRTLLDLTESNPTNAGIDYPLDELAEAMARGAREPYTPDPRGLRSAREALGDPDDIVITASTSEAYSFLFKLLCNPGDNVVTATPSYPLFEHLAGLELVELRTFPLEFHKRWELHAERVREQIDERTRAVIVVNPNNPTGSVVTPEEQEALAALRLPIISDEVFLGYSSGTSFIHHDALTFTLGGLSKSCGLPHYKLGWIGVHGPGKDHALRGLELIADNFLSASTPVQAALDDLLRIGASIHASIRDRIRRNLDFLQRAVAVTPSVTALPVEGGWSVVLRVPRVRTDEELTIDLVERSGVLVQPGYFFDFPDDGYLVVSLLTRPDVFEEGIARLLDERTLAPRT
jgi:aspartate/methionine/tyrosine aminotransferase